MVGVAVQCDRSSSAAATVVKGSVAKGMEEPSFCNLSLAVDCTLSLGSTTSRTDIPSRLSRAGSPVQDLDWSLSVRSEREVPTQREQDLSWGGSCNRSDPDLSPEFYLQVSRPRVNDDSRRGFKAWPRSSSSYKDEVTTSKALFSMIDDQSYRNRANRQPWLPTGSYLPMSKAEEDGDNLVRVCAHCGTSKTPLWRNGPGGPKSLCNACGIRFKKAGRRSAASGTADSEVPPSVSVQQQPKKVKRKLMPQGDEEPPYWVFPADAKPRKRSRGTLLHRTSESVLSGSCMTWQPFSSSFRSEDRKVPALDAGSFSSDEEEGAVLLMALSCGMVNVV